MKGITFVRILEERIHPVEAVKYIINKAKLSQQSSTRFAARIIPIERSCYAHVEEVLVLLKELIPAVFEKQPKGTSVNLLNWFPL